MKQTFLIFLFLIFSIFSYAQFEYQKGYFIDTANVRTECFIANEYWGNNPDVFYYKFSDSKTIQTVSSLQCKEVGIYNKYKFVSALVQIDESGDVLGQYSKSFDPLWVSKQLFLRVLIEGDASLYVFQNNTQVRYFYSLQQGTITQLVCKQYLVNDYALSTNNEFRNQLMQILKCDQISFSDIKNIDYHGFSLLQLFKKYNVCKSNSFVDFTHKRKNDNYKFLVGINKSSILVDDCYIDFINKYHSFPVQYGNYFERHQFVEKYTLSLGFEYESFLPYKRERGSLIIQPYLQMYNTHEKVGGFDFKMHYNIISFPFGYRFTLPIRKDVSIFSSLLFNSVVNLKLYSRIDIDGFTKPIKLTPGNSAIFELGVNYNKWSLKLSNTIGRDLQWWRYNLSAYYFSNIVFIGYKF